MFPTLMMLERRHELPYPYSMLHAIALLAYLKK